MCPSFRVYHFTPSAGSVYTHKNSRKHCETNGNNYYYEPNLQVARRYHSYICACKGLPRVWPTRMYPFCPINTPNTTGYYHNIVYPIPWTTGSIILISLMVYIVLNIAQKHFVIPLKKKNVYIRIIPGYIMLH